MILEKLYQHIIRKVAEKKAEVQRLRWQKAMLEAKIKQAEKRE